VATGFQTYKQINNWGNCEHVSVVVFSCNRWERRERQIWGSWFKLFRCGNLSTGKRRLSAGGYFLHLQDWAVEE